MIVKGQKSKVKSGGFTLVELIVALGLFVAVVTISIGSLTGLYDANNKSQALSSVINNLNFSMENMIRTIRFSTVYHCGSGGSLNVAQSCNSGDSFIAVSTSSPVSIFRLQNGKIETSTNSGLSYTPVTSNEVTIEHLRFYVYNTAVGDNRQPYVLLIVKGFAGKKPVAQSRFNIQTVVSQRQLDI